MLLQWNHQEQGTREEKGYLIYQINQIYFISNFLGDES